MDIGEGSLEIQNPKTQNVVSVSIAAKIHVPEVNLRAKRNQVPQTSTLRVNIPLPEHCKQDREQRSCHFTLGTLEGKTGAESRSVPMASHGQLLACNLVLMSLSSLTTKYLFPVETRQLCPPISMHDLRGRLEF